MRDRKMVYTPNGVAVGMVTRLSDGTPALSIKGKNGKYDTVSIDYIYHEVSKKLSEVVTQNLTYVGAR